LTGKVHAIRQVVPIEKLPDEGHSRALKRCWASQERASGSLLASVANDLYRLAARRHNTAARDRQSVPKIPLTAARGAPLHREWPAVVRMTNQKQGVLT